MTKKTKVCRSRLRCNGAPLKEGQYVCSDCAVELKRVRVLLQEDKKNWIEFRGKKRPPVCCAPGCYEPRVPPDAFCTEHEGEVEGEG